MRGVGARGAGDVVSGLVRWLYQERRHLFLLVRFAHLLGGYGEGSSLLRRGPALRLPELWLRCGLLVRDREGCRLRCLPASRLDHLERRRRQCGDCIPGR